DLRGGRLAAGAAVTRAQPRGARRRGARAVDAARSTLARAVGQGLPGSLRGRAVRAGYVVPSGHGVALARRALRRGLGEEPRRDAGRQAGGPPEVRRAVAAASGWG